MRICSIVVLAFLDERFGDLSLIESPLIPSPLV